jgi:hypothetical protein
MCRKNGTVALTTGSEEVFNKVVMLSRRYTLRD